MARKRALVSLASVNVPNAWANKGETVVFERKVRAGPVTGFVLSAPRATSADRNRRSDSADTVFSVTVEGRANAESPWSVLGSLTSIGGVYALRGDPELRALRGESDRELEDDLLSASFPAAALESVRVTLRSKGDRFAGTLRLDLMGP